VKAPLRDFHRPRALGVVAATRTSVRAALEDRAHAAPARRALRVAAVHFHQQERIRVARQAQVHAFLARVDHDAIHHLQRGGMIPRR
jgi:hypothetical protein